MVRKERRSTPSRGRLRRFGLVVLGLALLGGSFVAGYLAHRERIISRSTLNRAAHFLRLAQQTRSLDGHWNPIQPRNGEAELDPEQRREVQRLLSLGYASGTVPAPHDSGVTVRDTARASALPRYYVSGHEPVALLIDGAGRLLHRWHFAYPAAWSDQTAEKLTQSGFAPNTGCCM